MTRRPAVQKPTVPARAAAAPRSDAGADLVLLATFLGAATWILTSLLG